MTRSELPPEGGYFVVPKTIGWSMVSGIIAACIGGVWYASVQINRVDNLERSDLVIRARLEERADSNSRRIEELIRDRDRIVRLEEKMILQIELLRRIEVRLEGPAGRPRYEVDALPR